jgi:hypothetical protein
VLLHCRVEGGVKFTDVLDALDQVVRKVRPILSIVEKHVHRSAQGLVFDDKFLESLVNILDLMGEEIVDELVDHFLNGVDELSHALEPCMARHGNLLGLWGFVGSPVDHGELDIVCQLVADVGSHGQLDETVWIFSPQTENLHEVQSPVISAGISVIDVFGKSLKIHGYSPSAGRFTRLP